MTSPVGPNAAYSLSETAERVDEDDLDIWVGQEQLDCGPHVRLCRATSSVKEVGRLLCLS